MADHPSNAFYYFPKSAKSILDVGCNNGTLLLSAYERGFTDFYGIEINQAALLLAKEKTKNISNIQLVQGSADVIPFASETVDVATCIEVLEHVPSELRSCVISEIARILKQDGLFSLSVPYKGFFSFLDPANMRFSFPKLFSLISKILGGGGRDLGFVGQKHGVIWHYHFSLEELSILLEPHFEILNVRYRGAFMVPICETLLFPFYRKNKLNHFIARYLRKWKFLDFHLNWGSFLSYNILIVCKKKS